MKHNGIITNIDIYIDGICFYFLFQFVFIRVFKTIVLVNKALSIYDMNVSHNEMGQLCAKPSFIVILYNLLALHSSQRQRGSLDQHNHDPDRGTGIPPLSQICTADTIATFIHSLGFADVIQSVMVISVDFSLVSIGNELVLFPQIMKLVHLILRLFYGVWDLGLVLLVTLVQLITKKYKYIKQALNGNQGIYNQIR